ncbi:hypothetical protein AVEN_256024-1 [Araneus ventricosus]|uniref:Uncharacterized protein n=1 Tax=Araneus ventricosus TaxID=182803 RepID=A0A4Y2EIS7_ARAVE|nr:hypothetical protein AVEN_256024-1 [Araneus ventricosus]
MTYEPAIHSSYFRTIPAKGQLISTAKLACRKPWYTKDCSGLIEESGLWWSVSEVKRPLTGVVWKNGVSAKHLSGHLVKAQNYEARPVKIQNWMFSLV